MNTNHNLIVYGLNLGIKPFKGSLGQIKKIAVKKKLQTRYNEIEMDNHHKYSSDLPFNKISPYLQSKMLLMGQHTDYHGGVTLLKMLLDVDISQTQLFRVTNHYGEASGDIMEEELVSVQSSETDIVYAQNDGSMILTREPKDGRDGSWQEVKLCRVYHREERLSSGKRCWIDHSDYIAHIGSHKEFQQKAEHLIDPWEHLGERLVFISDGASWIHRWQKEQYPKATQILDFYHAMEHLATFAGLAIADGNHRKEWLELRRKELLESKLDELFQKIADCAKDQSVTVKKQKDKLIKYYKKNSERMDYKSYQQRGLQIGSGAIEAAHRNVIQKRLKLSGQRWTKSGAQNVLNLRACYMSGRWDKVIEMIRKPAA